MTDDKVIKLGDILFAKKDENTADITVPDSSIPAYLLKNDFLQEMRKIMCMKQMLYSSEWHTLIIRYCENMFSSPEMYLKGIIFTCLVESIRNDSVFEGFVSVCAVLKFVTEDILLSIGLDFRDLNSDIFAVFYDSVMKPAFHQLGGFRRFVKFIVGHRYLTWKWNWKDIVTPKDPTAPVNPLVQEDIMEKVKKEHDRRDPYLEVATLSYTSSVMAQTLMPAISVDFPPLPSDPALTMKLIASRNKKTGEKKRTKTGRSFIDFDSQGHSSSDLMTNRSRYEDSARYENIIQTVIRYNRSKSSGSKTSDNRIQKESDEILNRFKDKIKSLIAILDDTE